MKELQNNSNENLYRETTNYTKLFRLFSHEASTLKTLADNKFNMERMMLVFSYWV